MSDQSNAIVMQNEPREGDQSGVPPALNRTAWYPPEMQDIDVAAEITAYAGTDRRT